MSPQADPQGSLLHKVIDPSGGANQTGVRAYNERLVLSLVRRHAGLSKADITRRTGLSAQTVSVIMRALEKDGLLARGAPVRGRVGQPSTPMLLDPDGVFSFGLKVGRRSAELVLMDFVGNIRMQVQEPYAYPMPGRIRDFVRSGVAELSRALPPERRSRICGLGIAMPFELWNWAEKVGAPPEDMDAWREVELSSFLDDTVPFPVFLQNDATAACAAELVFGRGTYFTDFAYFFIGTFIGGGVVLNQALYSGRTGNAGAFGSMPIIGPDGVAGQLIDHASIFVLETMLIKAGFDGAKLWSDPANWDGFGALLDRWIDETARSLAVAIVSVCAVIDFEAVLVDGGFPAHVRSRVAAATRHAISLLDLQGISPPKIEEGRVGSSARAIGAASLPLFARYLIDPNVLFKETI